MTSILQVWRSITELIRQFNQQVTFQDFLNPTHTIEGGTLLTFSSKKIDKDPLVRIVFRNLLI